MIDSLNLKPYRTLIAGIDSSASLTETLARLMSAAEDGDPDANYLLAICGNGTFERLEAAMDKTISKNHAERVEGMKEANEILAQME